jgi:uncharacterized protein YceH (UPF0502 family)
MSSETPTTLPPPESWPALSALERRILGVLVEKAKTTPDTYPLSLNALATGCSQKSNRDPIMHVEEADAEDALNRLQTQGLVIKITGGRVVRWRHQLYERWQVNKVELALVADLLLRGAQTEGELRTHASRMEPIDDLEQLRQALRPLAEGKLIVMLGPEGRRGTLIAHGFYAAQELEVLQSQQGRSTEAEPASPGTSSIRSDLLSTLTAELEQVKRDVADLQARLLETQQTVAELRRQAQVS